MKLTINGIKPLTANANTRIGNGKYFSDPKKKMFDRDMKIALSLQKEEFRKFEASFDKNENFVYADLVIYIPNLFTKAGYISHHSGDLDNYAKNILDAIFKQFVDLDDKMICELCVSKREGKFYSMEVELRKFDLKVLKKTQLLNPSVH